MDNNPFVEFSAWFEQAKAAELPDYDAVSFATVGVHGQPSNRVVLMREFDARGFVFYTNLASRKARDLAVNSHGAMCFHWKSTQRQIRIEGRVTQVADEEADRYFASRPRESQIGAWASKQSQTLNDRTILAARVEKYAARFDGQAVRRPDFWSGFRLHPARFEFWDMRPHRLHERMLFTATGNDWVRELLYP